MELLQDGLIAFFSAVGVTACVWLTAGSLLGAGKCRSPLVRIVLPVRDDAPAMEADLRELVRLRRQAPRATIVLEDRGLTEEARRLLDAYDAYYADVRQYCEERFDAAFGFYRSLRKTEE